MPAIVKPLKIKDEATPVLEKMAGKLSELVSESTRLEEKLKDLAHAGREITGGGANWGKGLDKNALSANIAEYNKTLEAFNSAKAKELAAAQEIEDYKTQMAEQAAENQRKLEADLEAFKARRAERTAENQKQLEADLAENERYYREKSLSEFEAYLERKAQKAERRKERFIGIIKKIGQEITGLGKTTGMDSLTKRLTRMALTLVSARRLLTYMRNAIGRAPDAIAKPFTKLKEAISNGFAGWMVSLLRGLTDGLTALNAAFKSSSGQRFARGMETLFRTLGTVLGFVIEKASALVGWLGDHFQQVAMGVGIVVGLLAVKFALMAGAMMLAHWPLVLILGAVVGLMAYLNRLGATTEEVFTYIGQGVGWLYSLVYNLVADAWNLIASFAEFFANVWNDPLSAVAHLFVDVFDSILGVVETTAKAIDALLGSNLSSTVSGWRNSLQAWADDKYGKKAITVQRMEKLDPSQAMGTFGAWAGGVGASLSNASLERQKAQSLKSIASDTKSIKNAVTDEDLKNMIEVASRAFVSQVNLTSQTPVITINGANTGNTEEDRRRLGEAIKYILMEQVAAGSTSSPYVYSGR